MARGRKGNISDKQRKAMHANMRARGMNLGKTPQGMDADLNRSANVFPDTPANRKIWEKPGGSRRMDIEGIDTKPNVQSIPPRPKPVPAVEDKPKVKTVQVVETPKIPDSEFAIGDVIITDGGKPYTIKKIIGDSLFATDDDGGSYSAATKYAVKALTAEQAKDWYNIEQREIAEATRGNLDLLQKKRNMDFMGRKLQSGDITQAQYDQIITANKTRLSKDDYIKAAKIENQIAEIKNRPIPKPEGFQDKRIKGTADLLMYEAAHPPKEFLPPKDYEAEDTSKYLWGISEHDAVKRYEEKETKRLTSNIDHATRADTLFAETSKKYNKLSRTEKTDPKNSELRRDYYQWKEQSEKYHNHISGWANALQRVKDGKYAESNKRTIHESYVGEVKTAIKKGKPVPFDVIKQYPEFTKAQNSRDRYDKGRHTSFANVSIAIDDSKQEMHGVKIKRQDGKSMTEKHADEIIATLKQYQNAVGDITGIMKKENLTVAHTSGKHPFLSTFAGVYHHGDVTVTMGFPGVAAHEYTHFIDETSKKKHKDKPMYDYDLLAKAKLSWNGGAKQAISLSTRKSDDELKESRALRFKLGSYWERPQEIFARLAEQYTAYRNKDIPINDSMYTNDSYALYTETPAYWTDDEFKQLIPEFEAEMKRKIELAGREA